MPGLPPSKVTTRLVPGTRVATPGPLASAIDAAPMTMGVSVLRALATRMRTRLPPTEGRTRVRTVALEGPPVGPPVGEPPHGAIHCGPAAAPAGNAANATIPARAATARCI